MTPAQSFVGKPWTATESQSVTLNDASGKTLTVYMNKAQFATGFADMYVADKTGTIYGVAETYRENAQLIPTKKADIAALSTDQGGTDPDPTPGDAIYYESFGTADVSDKPLIADYTGWAKTGSGAGEVSYTGEGNMSIRTSGKLSAGYDGASGKNKAFFGTNNPALIINKIKLDGAQDLQLTFGAQYSKTIDYDAGLYDNEFKPEKFHLALSADGTSWTTVEYTYAQADEFWVFATSKFKLKNKAAYLYVKYAVDEASVFAIDDVTLAEGEGGTEVDLGEGSEEPEPTPGEAITVNELYRLAETVTGKDKLVIDAENNRTLEAVVVTDVDGGNVSANNLMVMTEGATQAKNGILLFSSGQYTNPKDPAFPFKSGDKVRFTLVKGLAKVANFSNCYEVTCESSDAATWLTAEVIGKAQLTPVPLTSIDNLIDYQGMLVTVKNVTSPATAGNWAVGTTTFKVGSSDLTVYVTQDAAGFAGKQYAASKTGDLTGYVSLYKGAVQLCPRNMTDAAAFCRGRHGSRTRGSGAHRARFLARKGHGDTRIPLPRQGRLLVRNGGHLYHRRLHLSYQGQRRRQVLLVLQQLQRRFRIRILLHRQGRCLHRTARHQRQGALEGHPDRCQRRIVFQRSLHHGYGGRRHRRRPVASSRTGHGNL